MEATNKTTWKLTLAYDGTEFHGWQVQLDPATTPTIQSTLAHAIAVVTGEQVLPQGAGRTDAGVHAAGQVASFSLAASIPASNLQRALNRILPSSIRVLAAEPVSGDFHARYSARGKVYRYQIFQGAVCPPFRSRSVALSRWTLDLVAMQRAAELILGEHDFTSFAAVDPNRTTRSLQDSPDSKDIKDRSNIRRIDRSIWSCSSPAAENSYLGCFSGETCTNSQIFCYFVQGNGFLHHMVRNLVGTFIEVGRGRIAPSAISTILAGRNRALAGPTAPASGLCLMKVLY